MKIALTVLSSVLLLVGFVWAGQGANLIGGSFMTGEPTWLVIGLICILSGLILLIWANKGRRFSQHGDTDRGHRKTDL